MEQEELELSHIEIRSKKKWGSYGKEGNYSVPIFYLIRDLGDEHIVNILNTQPQLSNEYKRIFMNELIFRMNYPQCKKDETSNPVQLAI